MTDPKQHQSLSRGSPSNAPSSAADQAADDLALMRKEYLPEVDLEFDPNPLVVFRRWFARARASTIAEPNAVALATTDASGSPSVRFVLLKEATDSGFTFFTNYESKKASDLAANPQAALAVYWDQLECQVRIRGIVAKIPPEQSDAYFALRPLGAQVAATVSTQSKTLTDRSLFEREVQALHQRIVQAETTGEEKGTALTRPEYWGGYRLWPTEIEFWQGAKNRLHHRMLYRRTNDDVWTTSELYP